MLFEMLRSPANAVVIKAAARNAVLAWAAIYLATFIALLGYRSSTRRYYLAQSEEWRTRARPEKSKVVQNVLPAPTVRQTLAAGHPLEPYLTPATGLMEELSSARGSVLERLKDMEDIAGRLLAFEDGPGWSYDFSAAAPPAEAEPSPAEGESFSRLTDSWTRLMSVPSLGELPDHDLRSAFGEASEDVRDVLRDPPNDWTLLHELFSGGGSPHVAKEPRELVCPGGPVGDDGRAPGPDGAASVRDLEERHARLERWLAGRAGDAGVSALMPDSRADVEEALTRAIQDLLADVSHAAETLDGGGRPPGQRPDPTACFDPAFVTAVVEAGLLAISARADVREALLKATLELDPTTPEESLILDADLPFSSPSWSGPGGVTSADGAGAVVNLRSVLDSPLLTKSARWVDQLVELLGGYSDEVDRYLDSLTDGGDGTVGEVAIESLLAQVGRVGDVDIRKVARTIAEKLPPAVRQKVLERL